MALATAALVACGGNTPAVETGQPPAVVALKPSRARLQEPALMPPIPLAAASVQVAVQDARKAPQAAPLPAALEQASRAYLARAVRGHGQPLRAVLSVHRWHSGRGREGERLLLDATLILGVAGAPKPLLAVRSSVLGTLPGFPFDGAEVAVFQRTLTAQLLDQLLHNPDTVQRLNAHLDGATAAGAGGPQSL